MNVKTKPYDLSYPNYRKQFGYLKVFAERPGMHLSYQIDDNDPKPLGLVDKKIKRFQFGVGAVGAANKGFTEFRGHKSIAGTGFVQK